MTAKTASAARPYRNPTLVALAFIFGYASIIGFTDNFVQVIAIDAGLAQFHLTRSLLALAMLGVAAPVMGLRLAPVNRGAVIARSLIHGVGIMIYFGCLAFLSVAETAAGLFTAPIFVLIISRFVYGIHIGPFRILAVLVGFTGVMLVLGITPGATIGPAMLLPIVAGVFYAMGNIATRQWCAEESAATLLGGFFAALGVLGLAGMILLTLWHPAVPEGADGFILRGPVWPTGRFLFWVVVQAAGSLVAVGAMVRAYQVAEASRVAVFEYLILPASAFWTYVIWGQDLGAIQLVGMVLIFVAGAIIALRRR